MIEKRDIAFAAGIHVPGFVLMAAIDATWAVVCCCILIAGIVFGIALRSSNRATELTEMSLFTQPPLGKRTDVAESLIAPTSSAIVIRS